MDIKEIWQRYENGIEYHKIENFAHRSKANYNFYMGKQWEGLNNGNEILPIINFIKPICKYKISMVAQHIMGINFHSVIDNAYYDKICKTLNDMAIAQWEKSKMDYLSWNIIKNACIDGEQYLYFYNETTNGTAIINDNDNNIIKEKIIDKNNIYFSDEQNNDINSQEYIIISERLPVKRVKEIAKKNKISAFDIEQIKADNDNNFENLREVKSDLGKCNCILYMEKTDEGIRFCRCTEKVIYQPFKLIKGLNIYPIAKMKWESIPNDLRGQSCVENLIPNQIEVNKTAARRAIAVKKFTFPLMIYDTDKIQKPEDLSVAGALIGVENLENTAIDSLIKFIEPANIPGDAQIFQNELIINTREMEGVGDAVLGQIDPSKASGEAIKATRDQAAIPLNEQISNYKEFVEEVANIWLNLWLAYSPNGIKISTNSKATDSLKIIPTADILKLQPMIRIDVASTDPFSKLSKDLILEKLFDRGALSFEEYTNSLSDNSIMPKAKFEEIIANRNATEIPSSVDIKDIPNIKNDNLPAIEDLGLEKYFQPQAD